MSNRVYVPGFGYVDSSGPGTRGSVKPARRDKQGQVLIDYGQGAAPRPARSSGQPQGFVPPSGPALTPSGSPGTQSSMSAAYGVDAGDPIVSFPNLGWYYSSADVYGLQDPSDPRSMLNQGVAGDGVGGPSPMWNFGMAPTDAEDAYDDDTLVPPGLRDVLDTIAKTIHPLKGGRSLWEEAVSASALASQRGEYVTPYAVLRRRYLSGSASDVEADGAGSYRSYGGGGGGYGGGGGGGGGSVSLTDPTSARGLLMQTMQGVLGRNPTNQEYKDFIDTLNQSEMANPRTVSVEGDVVVQSGGLDPSVLALEFAQGAEDYKATQANKFYNAFMGALAGGTGG